MNTDFLKAEIESLQQKLDFLQNLHVNGGIVVGDFLDDTFPQAVEMAKKINGDRNTDGESLAKIYNSMVSGIATPHSVHPAISHISKKMSLLEIVESFKNYFEKE